MFVTHYDLVEFEELEEDIQRDYLREELHEYHKEWSSLSRERKMELLESVALPVDRRICENYLFYGITPYLHFTDLDPMGEDGAVYFSDCNKLRENYKSFYFGWETHAILGNCWKCKGSEHYYYCQSQRLPSCVQCRATKPNSPVYHLVKIKFKTRITATITTDDLKLAYANELDRTAYDFQRRILDMQSILRSWFPIYQLVELIREYVYHHVEIDVNS